MDQIIAVAATLGGVILGFVLSEVSQERIRKREANDVWARLDVEVRTAIVVLQRVVETRDPQHAIEPPLSLASIETSFVELGRIVDPRVMRGFMAFLSWYRLSVEPPLTALHTGVVPARRSEIQLSPTGEIDDEGVKLIGEGIRFLKDLLDALYFDRELRRRRHRLWPWGDHAQTLREKIESALSAHNLHHEIGAFRPPE